MTDKQTDHGTVTSIAIGEIACQRRRPIITVVNLCLSSRYIGLSSVLRWQGRKTLLNTMYLSSTGRLAESYLDYHIHKEYGQYDGEELSLGEGDGDDGGH